MRPWCSQFPSRPGDPASGDTGGSESRQASTKTATSLSNAWFQPPRAPAAQSSLGKPVWFSVIFVLPPSRSSRVTVTIVSIDIPSGIPYCDGGTALPSASEGDSVATNRSSGTISRYTPVVWYSCPSGDCMPIKRRPPPAFPPAGGGAPPPPPPPLQRRGPQPARPPLRVTASLDQSRPLQHLQMLRYRRHAHLERRRQLGHRRLTVHQPRQNRPSRRISQRRERRTQGIGRSP